MRLNSEFTGILLIIYAIGAPFCLLPVFYSHKSQDIYVFGIFIWFLTCLGLLALHRQACKQ